MAGPWERYGGGAPAQGGPIYSGVDPEAARKEEDQRLQREAAARAEAQAARQAEQAGRTARKDELQIGAMERKQAAGPKAEATEGERKASGFYRRAMRANQAFENGDYDAPGLLEEMASNMPFGNYVLSDDRQAAYQNEREFIAAVLRYDSGAAIPPEEFVTSRKIYFPEPGDGEDVIKQKALARKTAMEGLYDSAGRLAPNMGEGQPQEITQGASPAVMDQQDAPTGSPPTQGGGERGLQLSQEVTPDKAYFFQQKHGHTYDQEKQLVAWLNSQRGKPFPTEDAARAVYESLGVGFSPETYSTLRQNWDKAAERGWTPRSLNDPYIEAQQQSREKLNDAGRNNPLGGVIMGAADAASLGFADELIGAIAGEDKARNYRVARDVIGDDNPVSYTGGQIGGALALPMKGGSVRSVAGQGAAYGAAYGAGSGETGEERVSNALVGGALGGALGAGGEKLTQLAKPGIERLASRLPSSAKGGQQAERNALLQAGQRQGVDLMPADVGGPGIKRATSAADQNMLASGSIKGAANRRNDQLGEAVDRVANDVGEPMTEDKLGEVVREAGDRFLAQSRERGGRLYDRANRLSQGVRPKPTGALQRIDEHLADLSETAGIQKPLVDELTKLRTTLSQDGGVSVGGLRDARTIIQRAARTDALRATNADRVLKDVADALSQDIETGLRSVGKDDAANAFANADKFWRERIEFIDQTLEPIIGKNASAESIVNKIDQMTRGKGKGTKVLGQLMQSMDDAERGSVQATFIQRMGQATPGAQGAEGAQFSANTFLTNWNKLSPRGKATMFPEGAHRQALDDIAKLAETFKETSKYTNSSNTGGVNANNMLMLGATGAGGLVSIPAVFLPALVSYGGGKVLASRRVAQYLARAPKTASPQGAKKWADGLEKIIVRDPILSGDAKALQQILTDAFRQTPQKAAAEDTEPMANTTTITAP